MRRRFLILACLGLILIGYATNHLLKSQTQQLFGDLVWHGQRDAPRIAITFDDGPSKPHTLEVLEILASDSVTATFFIVGKDMRRSLRGTSAIVAAGGETQPRSDQCRNSCKRKRRPNALSPAIWSQTCLTPLGASAPKNAFLSGGA